MAEASVGETHHAAPWQPARTAGALLATLSGVPYALFVLAVPLSLVTPGVVRDVGLSSTTTLSRAITAATCGMLLAGVLAAGAVGRRVPAHLVSLAGLVILSAGALWLRTVGSLAELALARAAQGIGAGAVLVATLATAATFGQRWRGLLAGGWVLSVVVATAVAPWATYRLAFVPGVDWRTVLAPYPWLLAAALVGTAAVALTSLGSQPGSQPPAGRADPASNDAGPAEHDGRAGRLGGPLLLPAGIAVGAYLIKPSLYSAGGTVTLYSLLLGTALVTVTLAGFVLARSAGWRWGAAPPVVAVTAAVLTVTATNTFTVALFAGAGHWPLATGHVLPAIGGAALAGGLATILGSVCPPRRRRALTVGGLLLAAAGGLVPLAGGVVATAGGTIVVWAGAGLALGAVLRITGTIAAGWLAAGFVVVSTLASVQQSSLRTAFTTGAAPAPGDAGDTDFLHTGFTDAQRVWIVISAVLLVFVAAVVARIARTPLPAEQAGPGGLLADDEDPEPGADAAPDPDSAAEEADAEAQPADRVWG